MQINEITDKLNKGNSKKVEIEILDFMLSLLELYPFNVRIDSSDLAFKDNVKLLSGLTVNFDKHYAANLPALNSGLVEVAKWNSKLVQYMSAPLEFFELLDKTMLYIFTLTDPTYARPISKNGYESLIESVNKYREEYGV